MTHKFLGTIQNKELNSKPIKIFKTSGQLNCIKNGIYINIFTSLCDVLIVLSNSKPEFQVLNCIFYLGEDLLMLLTQPTPMLLIIFTPQFSSSSWLFPDVFQKFIFHHRCSRLLMALWFISLLYPITNDSSRAVNFFSLFFHAALASCTLPQP